VGSMTERLMESVDWLAGEWLRGIRLEHRIPIKLALTSLPNTHPTMFHPVRPTVYQHSTLGKVTWAYSGVHRRRQDDGFSAYPRMLEVVRRAEACGTDDHTDSFDNLFLGDCQGHSTPRRLQRNYESTNDSQNPSRSPNQQTTMNALRQ